MRNVFSRCVAPALMLTVERGTPSQSATSFSSAAFALPLSGTAHEPAPPDARGRRRTSRRAPISSLDERGVSRTNSSMPLRATPGNGRRARCSDDQRRDRGPEQELPDEKDDQEQDDRRDVDAAEIGQQPADRP